MRYEIMIVGRFPLIGTGVIFHEYLMIAIFSAHQTLPLMLLVKQTIYIVRREAHNKDSFVVHRHQIGPYGGREIQENYIVDLTLPEIRRRMRAMKLYCVERTMGEDPLIVEKWI